jgi:hypothetical protein
VKAIELERNSYQKTLSEWVKYDKFYPLGQCFSSPETILGHFSATIFSILLSQTECSKKSKCKQNSQKVIKKPKKSFLFFSFTFSIAITQNCLQNGISWRDKKLNLAYSLLLLICHIASYLQ